MKAKEWIINTINHKDTGKVPYNFSFSPKAVEKVSGHFGGSIEKTAGFPIRMSGTVSIKPLYVDTNVFGDMVRDEFGVVWHMNDIDRGSPISCLKENTLDGYKFPDFSNEYRFERLGEWCAANKDYFTIIWVGDLWERATFMRGMEDILLDLYLEPEFVHDLMRGLTDYILGTMKVLFSRFEFDGIAVSDDYGTQTSMIMSPDTWREFVKPYLKEIYDYAKVNGKYIFHHTCGHVVPIINDMIEIGLDILHPIQPEAMDIEFLKKEFGSRVTFCGGLNTQHLLPFGTPDEIRTEIKRLKRILGAGGGYILEPGITVQADVPAENIIAAIEEASLT